uniref:Uncharacterized protein n=1 Tax=Glossina pallidipes TaxID=7398 RepID=A0A1B0A598_GLOPL
MIKKKTLLTLPSSITLLVSMDNDVKGGLLLSWKVNKMLYKRVTGDSLDGANYTHQQSVEENKTSRNGKYSYSKVFLDATECGYLLPTRRATRDGASDVFKMLTKS